MTASSPPDGIPMGHLPDQGLTLFYELYFRWNEEQDALELEAAQQRETLHVQATA